MIIRAWRLLKANYAKEAFSGEGAFKYGGRWNSIGTRVVYTAESIALATLEILAGGAPISLLGDYIKIPVEFDDSLIHSPDRLPDNWDRYPPGRKTREIGDAWARESKSLVLKVPSAVVKEECIYIINPFHPDAAKRLKIGKTEKFHVDKRFNAMSDLKA
jgi:RES domain-containing protein